MFQIIDSVLAYDVAFQSTSIIGLAGFTSMSKEVPPHMVMEFLNILFSKFDDLCDSHGVYKVRTCTQWLACTPASHLA